MKATKTILMLAAIAVIASAVPAAAEGMTWAGSIFAGYAKTTKDIANGESPDGSLGVRGNIFAMMHPVIGVGVEAGYHALGTLEYSTALPPTHPTNPDGTINTDIDFKSWQGTAQVIARGNTGTIRPYGTGGLGVYVLRNEIATEELDSGGNSIGTASADNNRTKVGFNLGGGVQFRPSSGPIGFGVEGRWHEVFKAITDSDDPTKENAFDFFTITGGITFN